MCSGIALTSGVEERRGGGGRGGGGRTGWGVRGRPTPWAPLPLSLARTCQAGAQGIMWKCGWLASTWLSLCTCLGREETPGLITLSLDTLLLSLFLFLSLSPCFFSLALPFYSTYSNTEKRFFPLSPLHWLFFPPPLPSVTDFTFVYETLLSFFFFVNLLPPHPPLRHLSVQAFKTFKVSKYDSCEKSVCTPHCLVDHEANFPQLFTALSCVASCIERIFPVVFPPSLDWSLASSTVHPSLLLTELWIHYSLNEYIFWFQVLIWLVLSYAE